MLLVENISVSNFEGAFRGLRNPMNSWAKSDSIFSGEFFSLGEKDLDLAQRMIAAGTDESKFLRQIFISMDITAPLYWWKEFDTYKVGTVANSCSTMHKLTSAPITMASFSFDAEAQEDEKLIKIVSYCEELRLLYLQNKDKRVWRKLIQVLPSAFNQKRTVTLSYQNARAMFLARRNHKLTEWHTLCKTFESLPYGKELITYIPLRMSTYGFKTLIRLLGVSENDNAEQEVISKVKELIEGEKND